MTDAELYHRTFERYRIDPKLGEHTCPKLSCHDAIWSGKPVPQPDELEFAVLSPPRAPNTPFRSVSLNGQRSKPKAQSYGAHQSRYNAMQSVEGGLPGTIIVIEKSDQRFIDYASQWELRWSAICQHGGRFHPVVNDSLTVIGHYGSANGNDLVKPEGVGYASRVADALEAGVPIFFIGTNSRPPKGWVWADAADSTLYIVTGEDGEVVAATQGPVRHAQSMGLPIVGLVAGEILVRMGVKVLSRAFGYLLGRARQLVRTVRRPTVGMKWDLPPARVVAFGEKKALASVDAAAVKQTGIAAKKIRGTPDGTVAADNFREAAQAQRFASRADVDEVYMGQVAKKTFDSPAGKKFPDVVARKRDGSFLAGEGKGTDMAKAIKQFEEGQSQLTRQAARGKLGGRITEQEVVVQKLTASEFKDATGRVIPMAGPGYGVDAQGYLLNMVGPAPWGRIATSNGVQIRVISLE